MEANRPRRMRLTETLTTPNTGRDDRLAADTAAAAPEKGGKGAWSLRTKSHLAYLILALYALFLTGFVLQQKHELLQQFDQLQIAYDTENRLRKLLPLLDQAIDDQEANMAMLSDPVGKAHVREHLAHLRETWEASIANQAQLGPEAKALGQAIEAAGHELNTRTLQGLRDRLSALRERVAMLSARSEAHRNAMIGRYRDQADHASSVALLLGLLGLALLGIINGVFFSRLTRDLGRLEKATRRILRGERGVKIAVRRQDELGRLAQTFNELSETLRTQERELEIERQKNFHQEKMAAIGTLAAGIAHEVGNPIAAIEALVRNIQREAAEGGCPYLSQEAACKLDMILEHAERLGKTTREISGFARQHPTNEPELLDLNSLIRNTCRLMRFDSRWKNIDLQLRLDNGLPAIRGIGDQLTQVIMNLLVNAADAIEEAGASRSVIAILTYPQEQGVCIEVRDSGCGMDASTLEHAQETFFTTKAAGKGTGLGLSLCRSIVEAHGGDIEIESTPGEGTRVKVCLPLNSPGGQT